MALGNDSNQFDIQDVRKAFENWSSAKTLGQQTLSQLQIVTARCHAEGYTDDTLGRGLALRQLLQDALNTLKPNDQEPTPSDSRWHVHIALTERFVYNHQSKWVTEYLNVSRRTLSRKLKQGLQDVYEILLEWESEAHAQQVTRPASYNPVPFLAPPLPAHQFVGHTQLLSELKNKLLQNVTLALHGLPGVGKTALTLALVHNSEIRSEFPDGVLWASLGHQPNPLTLLGHWAKALSIPSEEINKQTTLRKRADLVRSAIGQQKLLLIIDDAWNSQAALALKVGGPKCAHLITTRLVNVAMDFAGQEVFLVPELDIEDGLSLLGQLSPNADYNSQQAHELVRMVGGLPLALMLIGRFLNKQSYGVQSRRLQRALDSLRTTSVRLQLAQPLSPLELPSDLSPEANLSLQTTIGLSDGALREKAQQAFYDLAIFAPKPNSFDEAAALAVTQAAPSDLDLLVDHGLLEIVDRGRYALHRAIRDYIRLQLQSKATIIRFISHYFTFITKNAYDYDKLDNELQNLKTMLACALEKAEHQLLLQALEHLMPYFRDRGLHDIGLQYLNSLLQIIQTDDDNNISPARVQHYLGALYLHQGQYGNAKAQFQESLILSGQSTNTLGLVADNLYSLGFIDYHLGDYKQAQKLYNQSLMIYRSDKDNKGESKVLNALGDVYLMQERFDNAKSYYEQASPLYQLGESQREEGHILIKLGYIHSLHDDHERSRIFFEEAEKIHHAVGERSLLGQIRFFLAHKQLSQGNYIDAHEGYQEALQIHQEMQNFWASSLDLVYLGFVDCLTGRYESAQMRYQQAEQICDQYGYQHHSGNLWQKMSIMYLYSGKPHAALEAAQRCLQVAQELDNQTMHHKALIRLGAAQVVLEQIAEAAQTFQAALALQEERLVPPSATGLAGAAHVAYMQRDLNAAQSLVQQLLQWRAEKGKWGVVDPSSIYFVCYQILQAVHNPQATTIRAEAVNFIQNQAVQFEDTTSRRAFLENVPARAQLLATRENKSR